MGEAAAKEPTMEDILSSIRKIIAEEGEPEAEQMESKPALDSPVEVVPEAQAATLQDIVAKTAPLREAAAAESETVKPEQEEEITPASGGGSLASIAATLKAKDDEPAVQRNRQVRHRLPKVRNNRIRKHASRWQMQYDHRNLKKPRPRLLLTGVPMRQLRFPPVIPQAGRCPLHRLEVLRNPHSRER